jgi:DNA polymerase-3 subunit delta
MVYLIIADDNIVSKEINNIISNSKVDSNSIFTYDLTEDSFNRALDSLDTISMFKTQKIVVCKNINKLDEEEKMLKYLENPTDDILILTANTKLNEKKQVFKKIMEAAKIIDPAINVIDYIKNGFKDYRIDFRTIITLQEYTGGDITRLDNEIEKLKLFKMDEKYITNEDVDLIVTKNITSNIFDLIDALDKKNKTKVFQIYDDLIKIGEDEIKIISLLATNYRLIYQVKILGYNYNPKEIKEIIKQKPYTINKAIERSYFYTENRLLDILKKLSDLDINIKSGKKEKEIELPIFLSSI